MILTSASSNQPTKLPEPTNQLPIVSVRRGMTKLSDNGNEGKARTDAKGKVKDLIGLFEGIGGRGHRQPGSEQEHKERAATKLKLHTRFWNS